MKVLETKFLEKQDFQLKFSKRCKYTIYASWDSKNQQFFGLSKWRIFSVCPSLLVGILGVFLSFWYSPLISMLSRVKILRWLHEHRHNADSQMIPCVLLSISLSLLFQSLFVGWDYAQHNVHIPRPKALIAFMEPDPSKPEYLLNAKKEKFKIRLMCYGCGIIMASFKLSITKIALNLTS